MVSLPAPPDSKLFIDEETKRQILEEQMKKMEALEVFAIGDGPDLIDLEVGDKVHIPAKELNAATLVNVNGEQKAVLTSFAVAIIW